MIVIKLVCLFSALCLIIVLCARALNKGMLKNKGAAVSFVLSVCGFGVLMLIGYLFFGKISIALQFAMALTVIVSIIMLFKNLKTEFSLMIQGIMKDWGIYFLIVVILTTISLFFPNNNLIFNSSSDTIQREALIGKSEPVMHLFYNANPKSEKVFNDPINLDADFTIELIVKPFKDQVNYSNIISTHKDFKGFTVEKDNTQGLNFNFFYGDGKRWNTSKMFALKSDKWNYIAIVVNTNGINVYLNGKNVSYTKANLPIQDSGEKISIGNWFVGTRPFNGIIREVLIQGIALNDSDIIKNWNQIRRSI
ncbi:MAG: LamG domain-containing protein [Elusimicrobiota bacterium]